MILITGGSGFIGSVLAQRLVNDGEKVRIFDIIDSPNKPNDAEFFMGDIRNVDDVRNAMEGIDIVYHCVALVPLAKAGKKFWDVNVIGTQILLDECRRKNIDFFASVSSSTVFGIPKCPITKYSSLQPVEIYGKTKLAGEKLVWKYIAEGGKAAIIRPRTVIGDFRLGIFSILFEWISDNRSIYLIGNGNNLLQFIHIDDLVDAIICARRRGVSGIYNIGTDQFGTLGEDIQHLITSAKSKSKIFTVPPIFAINVLKILDILHLSPLAPWHYLTYHKSFYFDVSDEKSLLDWTPKFSNKEMLISSYNWFLNNKAALSKMAGGASIHHSQPRQMILKLLKWLS